MTMQFDSQAISGYAIIALIAVVVWEIVRSIFVKILAEKILTLWNRKNDFTGTWEDDIFDSAGLVVKNDKFTIIQNGSDISGLIERIFPINQSYKKWNFRGHLQDDSIVACFWPVDTTDSSYGCLFVKKKADKKYSGYYLSQTYLAEALTDANNLHPTQIALRKVPNR